MNIIKVLRLSRLVRALRLVVQFRMLWQLIRGLYSTLNLMFNTAVLVTLLLYIFACLGVELITKEPEARLTAEQALHADFLNPTRQKGKAK